MVDQTRLLALRAEYEDLKRLDDETPQRRGQRLNGLVADVLAAYHHRARANDTGGTGEVDVAFSIRDTRFILEAKWQQKPVPEDPISKLRGRVSQRLAGTVGVLLSMSGYTGPAVRNMRIGNRLEVVLLTVEHFEAMLFEFVDPDTLFGALLDEAHFRGNPLTPLAELYETRELPRTYQPRSTRKAPGLTCALGDEEHEEHDDEPCHLSTVPPVSSARELSDGRLLLAGMQGLGIFDQVSGTTEHLHRVPVSGLVGEEPEVYAVGIGGRGIGRFADEAWSFRAAETPDSGEFVHSDWWFGETPEPYGHSAILRSRVQRRDIRLEHADLPMCVLADGQFVTFQTGWSSGETPRSDGSLWLFEDGDGDGHVVDEIELPGTEAWRRMDGSVSLVAVRQGVVLTTGGGHIYFVDTATEEARLVARVAKGRDGRQVFAFGSPTKRRINVAVPTPPDSPPGYEIYGVPV